MISEMERLILKADVAPVDLKLKGQKGLSYRRKSSISKEAPGTYLFGQKKEFNTSMKMSPYAAAVAVPGPVRKSRIKPPSNMTASITSIPALSSLILHGQGSLRNGRNGRDSERSAVGGEEREVGGEDREQSEDADNSPFRDSLGTPRNDLNGPLGSIGEERRGRGEGESEGSDSDGGNQGNEGNEGNEGGENDDGEGLDGEGTDEEGEGEGLGDGEEEEGGEKENDDSVAGRSTTRGGAGTGCSDETSLDDSSDPSSARKSNLGDQSGQSSQLQRSNSSNPQVFSHNSYTKRLSGSAHNNDLGDSTESGSDFLNVPDLYVEDCKSSSNVAKEYLKALAASSPKKATTTSPPLTVPQGGTWGKCGTGDGKYGSSGSVNSIGGGGGGGGGSGAGGGGSGAIQAPKRLSINPKAPSARKFGFIPSPSLTRSLSKVAKDSERTVPYSSGGNSRRSSSSARSESKGEARGAGRGDRGDKGDSSDVCNINDTSTDSRGLRRRKSDTNMSSMDPLDAIAAAVQVFSKPNSEDGSSTGNHVLFGVSQMLAILKKHVEKSR